jgi:hypothetical protein
LLGQSERLAAAVIFVTSSRDETALFKAPEQLRYRRRRDGGAARELRADDVALVDCLQREILSDCQRRVMRREQTLDPPAHERRRPHERFRRLSAADVVTRSRQ